MVVTRGKRGGEPGGAGRGHLHNIPFIHRTKQTSTESLSRLEVGSMGKGRNKGGTGVSLKKIQVPPQTGVPGGNLVCFNPRGIRRSKAVWEGQNRQGWREEEEGPGGGGAVWQLGEGTALPLLGSPQPLRSGRKGAACNPHGQVWGCQMLQAGGWRGLTKACPPER